MRFPRVLLSIVTLVSGAAHADRTPKFVATLANQVINEVRTETEFSFERCDFVHLDGSKLSAELAAQSFGNCATLGRALPLGARAAVISELNRQLTERRRDLKDPNVLYWAAHGFVQGALFGGVLMVGGRRFLLRRPFTARVATRDFARGAGFGGVVTSWGQAHGAITKQGQNQMVLGVVDDEMPEQTYELDQRTHDRGAQLAGLDFVADIITRVTAGYVP